MATYKDIHGFKIQNVSSDPPTSVAGDMWYNSTSGDLKVNLGTPVGSWSTGGSLNTAIRALGGAGTQTAALAFGGNAPPGTADTESYNGSSWTELNNLNTARGYLSGTGTTNTAALAFGGALPTVAITESWNGSNWTEVNDLNTARYNLSGVGSNTAALAFGGVSETADTELWNGSNWTEVNNLNSGRASAGSSLIGTTTASLIFGGRLAPAVTNLSESWNGTNWTEVADLNVSRDRLAGSGNDSAALAFGGATPPHSAATEEWNLSGGVSTIDAS